MLFIKIEINEIKIITAPTLDVEIQTELSLEPVETTLQNLLSLFPCPGSHGSS